MKPNVPDHDAVEIPVTVKTPPEHRRILIERTELVQAAFNRLVSEAETAEQ